MKYTTEKQIGFGNRIHVLTEDHTFNGYTLRKGLRTDGGSIPKIFVLGLFLLLNAIYDFHWLTNVIIFAIAIDESNGWFQKPFFAHDQRWADSKYWTNFWKANYLFHKDMLFKVNNYKDKFLIKIIFHMLLGYLLAIIYPLSVCLVGWLVFYFKYRYNKKID